MKRTLKRAGITKQNIALARLWLERSSLSLAGGSQEAQRPRILCYHSVGTPEWGVNDVSPAVFRRQLEIALQLGYRFVLAEEIVAGRAGPKSLAITFDDGLKGVLEHAAPVMRELNIPWTLFVVTDWLDGRHAFRHDTMLSWKDLEKLANTGVNIGSHSVSHPNFASLSSDQVTAELDDSRRLIDSHLGIRPDTFAIPMGRFRDWSQEASRIAAGLGYRTIFSQAENLRPPGTVPRTFITRLDGERFFRAAIRGKFDDWEEWVWPSP